MFLIDDIGNNQLNTNIFLIPSKIKSFAMLKRLVTNSGGDLGIRRKLNIIRIEIYLEVAKI